MKHQRTRQTDRKIHWTEVEPPSVFLSVVIRAYQTLSPNISHRLLRVPMTYRCLSHTLALLGCVFKKERERKE